eukprot:s259_g24.t1
MALILPGVAINVAPPSLLRAPTRAKRRAEALPERRGLQVAGLCLVAARWQMRRRMRIAVAALGDESEMDIAGLIESLQGQWEDDVGLSIKVNGNEVDFGDGTGAWRLQADATSGLALELRGTRFVGTKESPMWQFPNGVRRSWKRAEAITPEQLKWKELFLTYKADAWKQAA